MAILEKKERILSNYLIVSIDTYFIKDQIKSEKMNALWNILTYDK